MILDDLFTFAAQNWTSANEVTVQANVTTNHTGGLRPPATNNADVQPALRLVYVPGREIKEGGVNFFSPASFQTQELTIAAPRANIRGSDTYTVVWLGNTFTATVDGTTNVVYGVAGQQFITISLCNLIAFTNQ